MRSHLNKEGLFDGHLIGAASRSARPSHFRPLAVPRLFDGYLTVRSRAKRRSQIFLGNLDRLAFVARRPLEESRRDKTNTNGPGWRPPSSAR